ncbi:hypothetical protein NDU88_004764 [Pleurodeles waltl]|uniref:Uncharacterized protein n=1 Tax=Pleurodeles waltl TaxID=8319 RepID=A0AAV7LJB9_PLEWA|nr:hypothetical protein NDU88_004764 [Pleurodeles waltl]
MGRAGVRAPSSGLRIRTAQHSAKQRQRWLVVVAEWGAPRDRALTASFEIIAAASAAEQEPKFLFRVLAAASQVSAAASSGLERSWKWTTKVRTARSAPAFTMPP